MPRYKLTIEYDGARFSGWQIQPKTKTVEGKLEEAFSKILQTPIDLVGQGRTDTGVHARGQVAHLDLPNSINPEKLICGVNGLVGNHIQIHNIEKVNDNFHARYDAVYREYKYLVLKRNFPLYNSTGWFPGNNIELKQLKNCAHLILGEHDFNGFSKFNQDNCITLCTILDAEWEERKIGFVFSIQANRFLRNMVRRIVGTSVKVANRDMDIDAFKQILENSDLKIPAQTAPAKGLALEKVFY